MLVACGNNVVPISGRSRAPAPIGRKKLYPRLRSAGLAGLIADSYHSYSAHHANAGGGHTHEGKLAGSREEPVHTRGPA